MRKMASIYFHVKQLEVFFFWKKGSKNMFAVHSLLVSEKWNAFYAAEEVLLYFSF